MGSNTSNIDQQPVHSISFTYNLFMDTTEVTQGGYSSLMAVTHTGYTDPPWNSAEGIGSNFPVYYVNWYDAVLYCNARSRRDGYDTVYSYTSLSGIPGNDCELSGLNIDLTKNGYRLPTETEWEYACRAGTTTNYYWGSGNAGDYAWYEDNSDTMSHMVAKKIANGFGLYDISGNLFEWCNDWYGSDYYSSSPGTDPTGPSSGPDRVVRGGGWNADNSLLRSAIRRNYGPTGFYYSFGLRVVLPVH